MNTFECTGDKYLCLCAAHVAAEIGDVQDLPKIQLDARKLSRYARPHDPRTCAECAEAEYR